MISGTGSLTLTGGGALTLTAANTYTGGTNLNAGTLLAGNNSAFGTGTLTMAQGTTLGFSGGNYTIPNKIVLTGDPNFAPPAGTTQTLSGPITDGASPGTLNLVGDGTLVLSGTSSYTGPTNVNAGTLQAGASNVFAPASAFTVAGGATLNVNGFNETIGSLSGAGNVTLGSGALSLVGASGLFSGSLTGTGTLTLTNTEILTGSNSGFAGTTMIGNGGNLIVGTASSPTAVLGGTVSALSGGMLSGFGTINGSVANSAGTVTPGPIGTLTIKGNFAQGAGGTFVDLLTPSGASLLAVGGSASLNGTLQAQPAAGTYTFNTHYPILTAAGGINGTFATFINKLPSVNLSVDYLPNEIDLVTAGANFAGQTRNEIQVATALNLGSMTATGDFLTELEAIAALPSSQQQQVLASLGGQIYANMGEVSLQNRQLFLGAMDERMQPLSADGSPGTAALRGLVPGGWGGGANATQFAMLSSAIGGRQSGGDPMNPLTEAQMVQAASACSGRNATVSRPADLISWARGFGQFGSLGNNGGAHFGADYSTGGGAVGLDVIRTPQTILGFAAGGEQARSRPIRCRRTQRSRSCNSARTARSRSAWGFTLDGAFIYAHDFYDVSRGLVSVGRAATSSYGGDDAVVDLGLRRPFAYNGWQVTPRAGFTYYHIGQSQFAESGANSLNLSVNPASLDALRSRVGFTLSQPMQWGGSQVQPELRAAWTHDFLDERSTTLAALAGAPGLVFQQVGASTGRDAAELGAGLSFAIAQTTLPGHLAAFVEYDATVAAHLTNNAFAAGLKLTW